MEPRENYKCGTLAYNMAGVQTLSCEFGLYVQFEDLALRPYEIEFERHFSCKSQYLLSTECSTSLMAGNFQELAL